MCPDLSCLASRNSDTATRSQRGRRRRRSFAAKGAGVQSGMHTQACFARAAADRRRRHARLDLDGGGGLSPRHCWTRSSLHGPSVVARLDSCAATERTCLLQSYHMVLVLLIGGHAPNFGSLPACLPCSLKRLLFYCVDGQTNCPSLLTHDLIVSIRRSYSTLGPEKDNTRTVHTIISTIYKHRIDRPVLC